MPVSSIDTCIASTTGLIDGHVVGAVGAASFAVGLGIKLWQEHMRHGLWIPVKSGKKSVEPVDGTPCKTCRGKRRMPCQPCEGWGRLNGKGSYILAKGENPIWCRDCRATGLVLCSRCMGTGVQPNSIGFRV